jgi:hypothetical protein
MSSDIARISNQVEQKNSIRRNKNILHMFVLVSMFPRGGGKYFVPLPLAMSLELSLLDLWILVAT